MSAKPVAPATGAPATTSSQKQYTAIDSANQEKGQLSLPEVGAAPAVLNAKRKTMQYEYLDTPIEPTGRQNRFVLAKLKENPAGLTTVEFTSMGVADPRPRIRDLREKGWRVETIQKDPHDVGRYVLMVGGGN